MVLSQGTFQPYIFKKDAGRVRRQACEQLIYSVTSTETENLRRLNAGALGSLPLLLVSISINCFQARFYST